MRMFSFRMEIENFYHCLFLFHRLYILTVRRIAFHCLCSPHIDLYPDQVVEIRQVLRVSTEQGMRGDQILTGRQLVGEVGICNRIVVFVNWFYIVVVDGVVRVRDLVRTYGGDAPRSGGRVYPKKLETGPQNQNY
ncbi:hypothetical protein NQ318_022386 [Aromia moschata]|uniref:Uncharacterized protein n=1 Tax=Aromia moschata TaxID=1265417 RepID=A0AAV8Z568_9CUCU|nr:hypothetical protein NQ318_022386 [Aromia moschata]